MTKRNTVEPVLGGLCHERQLILNDRFHTHIYLARTQFLYLIIEGPTGLKSRLVAEEVVSQDRFYCTFVYIPHMKYEIQQHPLSWSFRKAVVSPWCQPVVGRLESLAPLAVGCPLWLSPPASAGLSRYECTPQTAVRHGHSDRSMTGYHYQ